jgi:DNA-binding helix-hairpin-helix protein with protein kinase domain
MTNYTDSTGAPILLTKELGAGGEGAVYTTDRRGIVAKILHDHKLRDDPTRRAKIEWMMKNIPGDIYTPKTATTPRITNISRPTSLVFRGGKFCGYLMPKITKSNELNLIINPSNRARQKIDVNTKELYRLAHNICTVYRVFHAKQYVIGDINTKNIMVSSQMHVTVVDCDSIQVHDARTNKTYPCKVGVREYTPPELVGKNFANTIRTPNNDEFAIAALVFQLLMQGHNPFSGTQLPGAPDVDDVLHHNLMNKIFPFDRTTRGQCAPPRRAPEYEQVIPLQLQGLFRRAFTTDQRPSAEEWTTALRTVIGTMVQCSRDATHMHPRGTVCTMCSWQARLASATTGVLVTAPTRRGGTRGNTQPKATTHHTTYTPVRPVRPRTVQPPPVQPHVPTYSPTPTMTIQPPAPLVAAAPSPPRSTANDARNGCLTIIVIFALIGICVNLSGS